jgi:AcrR family transcriptional regulator
MQKKKASIKVDPRVRRTRRMLRDALVSLILQKDFSSISIKDITDKAEVAYITFFRHYDSIDELLMEVLEDGLKELMSRIETLASQSDTSALEAEGKFIFEYIEQQAELFRILFKSQSISRIRKKIIKNIAIVFQKSCLPLTKLNNQTTIDITSNHIATSLLSLIEWWLENKMKPSPAEMGKVYKNLIIDSTVGAVKSLERISTF